MADYEEAGHGVEGVRLAVAPVTLPPHVQAWAATGLAHVLLEDAATKEALLALPARPASSVPLRKETVAASSLAVPPSGSDRPAPASVQFAKPEPRKPITAQEPPQSGVVASAPNRLAFADAKDVAEDPTQWDAPWAACFAKASPAPIVWTYRELGGDLLGSNRVPERGALFRNLIGALGLPKGSSAFWPCAVPRPGQPEETPASCASPAVYAAGLRLLAPRFVVLFGREALEDVGLPAERFSFFQHSIVDGKLVIVLPSAASLLSNSAQQTTTVSLLRAVFADHFRSSSY